MSTGELHILSTEKDDVVIFHTGHENGFGDLDQVADIRERLFDPAFRPQSPPDFLNFFLGSLAQAKMNADLKLYVHRVRKVLKRNPSLADLKGGSEGIYEREHRKVELGTFQVRKSRIFFNGVELRGDALEEWLKACLQGIWRDASFAPERATELARLIDAHLREAERKSLETLRRTLGDEAAEQLLRDGKITVRPPSGEEYVITDSAEVFRRSPGGGMNHICVQVDGEKDLPKYDRVLAKYLVIRDNPEQIQHDEGRGLEQNIAYHREVIRLYERRLARTRGEEGGPHPARDIPRSPVRKGARK